VRSETEVGFYNAAYRLITVWYLIPSSFMEVVFPILTKAHRHSTHKSEAIQQKALKYLLAIGLPLAIGSFAIAEQTISAFYGPGFEESILVFRIMVWHTVLAFANNVFWRILLARGEQNLAVLVQAVSGIIRVILSFVLGSQFGAKGAAWALMGGYTVYTLMHVYYVNRGGTQLPFRKLGGRFALASGVMGAITLYLSSFFSFFLLIPLAVFIYLAMVILLRAFSEEDMAIFYQLFPWRLKAKSTKAKPKGAD
jgi:O-antigen/teichoic acid export membrane protein